MCGGAYFAYFAAMYSLLSGWYSIFHFGNFIERQKSRQHVPFRRFMFPGNRRNRPTRETNTSLRPIAYLQHFDHRFRITHRAFGQPDISSLGLSAAASFSGPDLH